MMCFYFFYHLKMASKRLLEFKIGDTESNHQSLSKSELTVHINNNIKDTDKFSPYPKLSVPDAENVERFVQPIPQTQVQQSQIPQTQVPVEQYQPKLDDGVNVYNTISTTEIYTPRFPKRATSREPKDNLVFLQQYAKITGKLLTKDDKHLIINILDQSGRIILSANELIELIAALLSDGNYTTDPSRITLKCFEDISSCGCCGERSPSIVAVDNIQVDRLDFKLHYNDLYNRLQDEFFVSVNSVYKNSLIAK